jgi:hypothetical protein
MNRQVRGCDKRAHAVVMFGGFDAQHIL